MNIYEELDSLIIKLNRAGHLEFIEKIQEAKASGCVASEILYLVREELKRYPSVLGDSEKELGFKIEELIKKISHLLK
ncbi:hypothetical protein [Bacteriovorax sp. Seq25_V]|uniref:hypothetical protein n=1 Tax=Bacteriovorax sp. Seq25_V TaxID=1201288 RepID=UPI00038A420E|nr:hypothetical protein [Bacteriovorax sp. Seq25_V]EQC47152.1 hypothetical protein M900_0859 [Bacteriovorax sp. Seq25_V]